MDLALALGVVQRFKWLIAGGVLVAVILALLAYGTPGFSHGAPVLHPRTSEVWQSEAELMIAPAQGSGEHERQASTAHGPATPEAPNTQQAYFASLAPIYATLANGDRVQRRIHGEAPVPGTVKASEAVDTVTGTTLPFVVITALAPTQAEAALLAARASSTLRRYVAAEQESTPGSSAPRVTLQVIKSGAPAVLVKGHKLTVPLLVFVAALVAVFALAFVLENLRPRTAVALGRVDDASPQPKGEQAQQNGHAPRARKAGAAATQPSRSP